MTTPKQTDCKFLGMMCQRCSVRNAKECSCYEPRRNRCATLRYPVKGKEKKG